MQSLVAATRKNQVAISWACTRFFQCTFLTLCHRLVSAYKLQY
jgi:hypothetical protein